MRDLNARLSEAHGSPLMALSPTYPRVRVVQCHPFDVLKVSAHDSTSAQDQAARADGLRHSHTTLDSLISLGLMRRYQHLTND